MSKSTTSRPVNVLLIEDNPSDAALVEAHLSQSGVNVVVETAESLEAALEQVKRMPFEVALLDLSLPESQGLESFRAFHANARGMPIIVLTGLEDFELGLKALGAGAQDYLLKSKIDSDSLIRAIRYTLERSRRQRAESELMAAGAIQRGLFPRGTPNISGLDICGRCIQATFAGGDFFDYFPMGKNQLGVVIADAAGRGIAPAITMSETRAVIRSFASVADDVGEILTRSNRILARDLTKDTFVALFLACIDINARTLRFATAGHAGFVLNSHGKMKQLLKSSDPPLGVDANAAYAASPTISLMAEDALFLFTDEFAKSIGASGEPFGKKRVFDAIRERYQDGASGMLDALYEQLKMFRQKPHPDDDVTALVVKATADILGNRALATERPNQTDQQPTTTVTSSHEFEHFDVDVQGTITVLRILDTEVLSSEKCAEVRAEMLEYIQNHRPSNLVLSFRALRRFSSEGINICFQVKSALDANDGSLRLCDMKPQIREAFTALNLDGTIFAIHNDLEEALRSF